ncbi:hypothetical protein TorRG33x02_235310 [Trema orientale]|uniref:Uncharacterized protein n=1 Tax=Trema orientale TaxID=63057 RepID=A0A2P5E206_TREOI|nr:hypothetical protein TorRG33x02_235310 [Trema orientale]
MDRAPECGDTTFGSNGDGNQFDMSLTAFPTVSHAADMDVRRVKNLQVPSAGSTSPSIDPWEHLIKLELFTWCQFSNPSSDQFQSI